MQDVQRRPPLRAHSEIYRHSNLNKYIVQMYVTLTWDLAPVKNINNFFTPILYHLRQACKVLNILVRIPIDKLIESLSLMIMNILPSTIVVNTTLNKRCYSLRFHALYNMQNESVVLKIFRSCISVLQLTTAQRVWNV